MNVHGYFHGPRRIGRWNQLCLPRTVSREVHVELRSSVELCPVEDTPGVVLVRPASEGAIGGLIRRVTSVGQVVLPAEALQHLGKYSGDELYVGAAPDRGGLLVVSPEVVGSFESTMEVAS